VGRKTAYVKLVSTRKLGLHGINTIHPVCKPVGSGCRSPLFREAGGYELPLRPVPPTQHKHGENTVEKAIAGAWITEIVLSRKMESDGFVECNPQCLHSRQGVSRMLGVQANTAAAVAARVMWTGLQLGAESC